MFFAKNSLLSSLTLVTLALADDGLWHPGTTQVAAAGGQWGASAPAANQWTQAATPTIVVSAPTQAPPAASGDWQLSVTWPAGCEKWANPCPPGAPISGGGIAGGATASGAGTKSYENPFTSYTTLTNSAGVITGMPAVSTVPAGVSNTASGSTLSTAVRSGAISTTARANLSASATTRAGFSVETTTSARPMFVGAASTTTISRLAAALTAIGLILALL